MEHVPQTNTSQPEQHQNLWPTLNAMAPCPPNTSALRSTVEDVQHVGADDADAHLGNRPIYASASSPPNGRGSGAYGGGRWIHPLSRATANNAVATSQTIPPLLASAPSQTYNTDAPFSPTSSFSTTGVAMPQHKSSVYYTETQNHTSLQQRPTPPPTANSSCLLSSPSSLSSRSIETLNSSSSPLGLQQPYSRQPQYPTPHPHHTTAITSSAQAHQHQQYHHPEPYIYQPPSGNTYSPSGRHDAYQIVASPSARTPNFTVYPSHYSSVSGASGYANAYVTHDGQYANSNGYAQGRADHLYGRPSPYVDGAAHVQGSGYAGMGYPTYGKQANLIHHRLSQASAAETIDSFNSALVAATTLASVSTAGQGVSAGLSFITDNRSLSTTTTNTKRKYQSSANLGAGIEDVFDGDSDPEQKPFICGNGSSASGPIRGGAGGGKVARTPYKHNPSSTSSSRTSSSSALVPFDGRGGAYVSPPLSLEVGFPSSAHAPGHGHGRGHTHSLSGSSTVSLEYPASSVSSATLVPSPLSSPTGTGTPLRMSKTAREKINMSFSFRSFPDYVEVDPGFPLLYRQFYVPSYFGSNDPMGKFVFKHCPENQPTPLARLAFNAPSSPFDLYTPRYVKGSGIDKVGMCPICIEPISRGGEGNKLFLKTKVSAYNYHMQYYHGICARSNAPFSPPIRSRLTPRPRASIKERKEVKEGKCHVCHNWIPLQGVKDVDVVVKEIFWWKHAAACHKGQNIEGEGELFIEDDVYLRVTKYTEGGSVAPSRAR